MFGYSADRFSRDVGFTGNFSHKQRRISLDAFFDELAVPIASFVDYVASPTVTSVAELLEPFDGPPNIWKRDAKLSRNVAVAHSLLM